MNKRFFASIIEICIGITLSILCLFGILDAFWSGMGTALILVGAVFLIRQIRYKTNKEYKEEVDRSINDERNRFLSTKAWSWAGYLFVLISAISTIILKIVGQDTLSAFCAYAVCLLMVLYWISYMVVRKKY